jgi:GTPase
MAESFSQLDIDTPEFVPSTTTTTNERKETVNLIFCGHVDAGKSTIGGQILFVKCSQ